MARADAHPVRDWGCSSIVALSDATHESREQPDHFRFHRVDVQPGECVYPGEDPSLSAAAGIDASLDEYDEDPMGHGLQFDLSD